MTICVRGRLLVFMFVTFSLQLVSGNSSLCGGGYRWDRNTEKCLPCELGYFRKTCNELCLYPSFGKGCQAICNCSRDQCNPAKGCPENDCPPGYLGKSCEVKCRYPSHGMGCQNNCVCKKEKCDPANGCQGIAVKVETTPAPQSRMIENIFVSLRHEAHINRRLPPRDTFPASSTTPFTQKETSIQVDAAPMTTTLNEKERDMVISIVVLGLVFGILTTVHISISHRLRVETNNRGEETKELDENTFV